MNNEFPSRCGIDCSKCEYKEKVNCPGCIAAGGKMFWGNCELASCCMDKKLDHCGKCTDFPCELLKKYSYDEKQGDNGKRIANLREWNGGD